MSRDAVHRAVQQRTDHAAIALVEHVRCDRRQAGLVPRAPSASSYDLVLVLLGDHQPSTVVSGVGGNRDVPVTVVAHDPAVIERVSEWGWQDGLRPADTAPVWPMDAFRDRFLTAFSGGTPAPASGAPR